MESVEVMRQAMARTFCICKQPAAKNKHTVQHAQLATVLRQQTKGVPMIEIVNSDEEGSS